LQPNNDEEGGCDDDGDKNKDDVNESNCRDSNTIKVGREGDDDSVGNNVDDSKEDLNISL
jgi:hypothetical protein